jgi:hypothetical protein
LYGFETWSLTLKEEDTLKVFENKVLRNTFGPESDRVAEGWEKLHDEKLHTLQSSRHIPLLT